VRPPCHSLANHRDAGDDGFGVAFGQQSEPRQAGQRLADFAERLGLKRPKAFRGFGGLTSIMVMVWPA